MHRSRMRAPVLVWLLAVTILCASAAHAVKDSQRAISVKPIAPPAPNPNWELKAKTDLTDKSKDTLNPNVTSVAKAPEGARAIGDDCTNPILISVPAALPYTDAGQTTCGRGNNYDSTCLSSPSDYDSGEDIIYKLTVTTTTIIKVTLNPKTTRYTGMLLDNSCPPNPATCIRMKTMPFNFAYSMDSVTLAPGDYYIMVDTWAAPVCIPSFDLTIIELAPPPPPPANDACANAIPISNVTNLAWSTTYATPDGPGVYITSPNIWYVYTATCDGTVTASLCGSAFDTKIRVYAGAACSFATVVAENDDFCDRQSAAVFSAHAGDQFLIEVGGYGNYIGNGFLTTSCSLPPSNDSCANAQSVGNVVDLPWSTTTSTNDGPGGYIVSPNIWFLYQSTCAGMVTISLCGSTFDTRLRVWAGAACDFATEVATDDDGCGDKQSRTSFLANAGDYFLIEVGGYGAIAGNGLLSIGCTMLPTDTCSQVTPYTLEPNVTTTILGNNLGSTNDCSLLPQIGESWQAFTINECMNVEISYCGTSPRFRNVYTVLADACPCGDLLFDDGWNATECVDSNFTVHWQHLAPGTYYYPIMLHLASGAGGPYQLNITGTPCLPGYCPASGDVCEQHIRRVQLDSIDNVSFCSSYSDFTAISTTMRQGTNYPITVTNGKPFASDECAIWIDWNHDFDFSDANEQLVVSGTPGTGPYTANIMPPVGGYVGSTRMRIRVAFAAPLNPCNNNQFGEVEDYTVSIASSGPAYTCGDANGDTAVNISDAVYLIAYIFSGGSPPNPLLSGNANCDGTVNISDAVYLIAYIFSSGPAPCTGC